VAMKLRRATVDDASDVLAWRNDPESIAASKTPKPVDRADHLQWFQRAIGDPNRLILVGEEDSQKIGMVRFDHRPDHWLVSINLAPSARGKGYGRKALSGAIDALRAEVGQCRIVAEVKSDNTPSLRLFEALGFVRQGEQEGFQSFVLE
jgi:RimJ/RimL family protein N-acetyltransferase